MFFSVKRAFQKTKILKRSEEEEEEEEYEERDL
jgi:hypothetical protein